MKKNEVRKGGSQMSMLFSGNLAVQEQSRQLFRCIYSAGSVTRPQILEQLNLPPTSLNRALDRLIESGLIEVTGQAASTGGRPASLFQIKRNARLLLGVSIDPLPIPTIRAMLMDLALMPVAQDLRVISTNTVPETSATDGDAVADSGAADNISEIPSLRLSDKILTAVVELERAARLAMKVNPDFEKQPELIGIGIDGSENLENEDRTVLQTALQKHFNCPVICDDGLTGARLLISRSINKQEEPVALLSFDEPITLVTSNQTAGNNLAGTSVGAYPVPDFLSENTCSLRPLNELLSLPALSSRFAALRNRSDLGFTDFCEALDQKKKKGSRLLEAAAEELALTAIGIACLSGLSNVAVSGELFESVPALFKQAKAKIAASQEDFGITVRLERQPFGRDLRAAGMAALVLARELAIN